jgi:DNA-directed RNA polymerase specialized sigma24 family protein
MLSLTRWYILFPDEYILHEEQPTTVADILDGIDKDDLKADIKSDIEAQSKEDIAKAMGCCLNGLQPIG